MVLDDVSESQSLAEQTMHQTNVIQTDNICAVFGTVIFVQHTTKQTLSGEQTMFVLCVACTNTGHIYNKIILGAVIHGFLMNPRTPRTAQ